MGRITLDAVSDVTYWTFLILAWGLTYFWHKYRGVQRRVGMVGGDTDKEDGGGDDNKSCVGNQYCKGRNQQAPSSINL